MQTVLNTMRVEQRKEGPGPYRFQRAALNPTDSLVNGIGNPLKPVWPYRFRFSSFGRCLHFSFSYTFQSLRCDLFAATGRDVEQDPEGCKHGESGQQLLANEVEAALRQHAIV